MYDKKKDLVNFSPQFTRKKKNVMDFFVLLNSLSDWLLGRAEAGLETVGQPEKRSASSSQSAVPGQRTIHVQREREQPYHQQGQLTARCLYVVTVCVCVC